MLYTVRYAKIRPDMQGAWGNSAWQQADTLEIGQFRPESSDHRPQTCARLLYDSEGLYGIFRVKDRYVRCVRTLYLDQVWKDSCVEIYVRPKPDTGYFNFEFSCGGALLCYHILDPRRVPGGFREFTPLPEADGRQVAIYHSLPQVVNPEIAEPVEWRLEFFIPFAVLEKYVGAMGNLLNQEWGANLYKCAEDSSHPHWASWAPIDELNFHLPRCFGTIRFDEEPSKL